MNDLLVLITLAGRQVALRAVEVQSVIEMDAVTPVPGTASFVAGLTALRSQALTVIDCRRAIGFDPAPFPRDTRAAVVEVDGYPYALLVDEIGDISEALSPAIEAPAGFGPGWDEIALGMVETGSGPALLVDKGRLVSGTARAAA